VLVFDRAIHRQNGADVVAGERGDQVRSRNTGPDLVLGRYKMASVIRWRPPVTGTASVARYGRFASGPVPLKVVDHSVPVRLVVAIRSAAALSELAVVSVIEATPSVAAAKQATQSLPPTSATASWSLGGRAARTARVRISEPRRQTKSSVT